MSKIKKLAAGLMAMLVALVVAVPAYASDYTITVSNSVTGQTYSAYKVFDATYSGDNVAYTISESDAWYSLVSASDSPFTLTSTTTSRVYNVSLKDGQTDTTVAAWFNAIESVPGSYAATAKATVDDSSVTLDVGSAGYYYITTTTGSLVTVTTAKPTVSVTDKNGTPDVEKSIVSSDVSENGTTNYAAIGDTVDFQIKVTDFAGTQNVTVVDEMDEGLELVSGSVKVTLDNTELTSGTDYTLTVDTDNSGFTIAFEDEALEAATSDSVIVVTYTGKIVSGESITIGNEAYVTYGDPSSTTSSTTKTTETKLSGFSLTKVIKGTTTELDGAKFKLYTSETGGDALKFNYDESTDTYTFDPVNGSVTEIEVGSANVYGLDADVTYYLEETVAPDGYNLLTAREEVKLTKGGTSQAEDLAISYADEVTVENAAGSSLPSTGGMGTTVLYVVGGALVICAVVLLVTKRRMGSEN